jgi:hypothetical protein
MSMTGVMKYIGVATRAVVTAAEWRTAGAAGQEQVEWSAANGYAVSLDQLSQAAIDALSADGRFAKIINSEVVEEPTPEMRAEAEALLKVNSSTEEGYGLDEGRSVDKDDTVYVDGEPQKKARKK